MVNQISQIPAKVIQILRLIYKRTNRMPRKEKTEDEKVNRRKKNGIRYHEVFLHLFGMYM